MVHLARHACLRAAGGLLAAAGLATLPLTAAPAAGAVTAPAAARPAAAPAPGAGGFPRLASLSPAAGPVSYYLNSGQVAVKAGGRTWDLAVSVSKSTLGVPGQALAQITTPYQGGDEAHDWTFGDFPAKDMTVSAGGSASASSGSALSPILSLTLAFKPSSHKIASCSGGGRQTTYTGRLTGSVKLVTGLHKLTVTATKVTFGQPSTLAVSTDFCVPSACSFASWDASSAKSLNPPYTLAAGVQVGRPGHLHYFAEIERVSEVSKSREILRGDGAIIDTAAPAFSKSHKTLSITTSKSGAVTGSATIGPAKAGTPSTSACTDDGTSYTETDVSYSGRFRSPAGHALEARTLLTGTEKVGLVGTGGFDIITSIKKK
ncbi:MAG TPA: hypothetical protein VHU92_18030 [Streptosporangiaceae bacterium]|nr:hypothetical protein [Streptosporangiaceae bacterium]